MAKVLFDLVAFFVCMVGAIWYVATGKWEPGIFMLILAASFESSMHYNMLLDRINKGGIRG